MRSNHQSFLVLIVALLSLCALLPWCFPTSPWLRFGGPSDHEQGGATVHDSRQSAGGELLRTKVQSHAPVDRVLVKIVDSEGHLLPRALVTVSDWGGASEIETEGGVVSVSGPVLEGDIAKTHVTCAGFADAWITLHDDGRPRTLVLERVWILELEVRSSGVPSVGQPVQVTGGQIAGATVADDPAGSFVAQAFIGVPMSIPGIRGGRYRFIVRDADDRVLFAGSREVKPASRCVLQIPTMVRVNGLIVGPGRLPIADAKVTLNRYWTVRSSANGSFSLVCVSPLEQCAVLVEAEGFAVYQSQRALIGSAGIERAIGTVELAQQKVIRGWVMCEAAEIDEVSWQSLHRTRATVGSWGQDSQRPGRSTFEVSGCDSFGRGVLRVRAGERSGEIPVVFGGPHPQYHDVGEVLLQDRIDVRVDLAGQGWRAGDAVVWSRRQETGDRESFVVQREMKRVGRDSAGEAQRALMFRANVGCEVEIEACRGASALSHWTGRVQDSTAITLFIRPSEEVAVRVVGAEGEELDGVLLVRIGDQRPRTLAFSGRSAKFERPPGERVSARLMLAQNCRAIVQEGLVQIESDHQEVLFHVVRVTRVLTGKATGYQPGDRVHIVARTDDGWERSGRVRPDGSFLIPISEIEREVRVTLSSLWMDGLEAWRGSCNAASVLVRSGAGDVRLDVEVSRWPW